MLLSRMYLYMYLYMYVHKDICVYIYIYTDIEDPCETIVDGVDVLHRSCQT